MTTQSTTKQISSSCSTQTSERRENNPFHKLTHSTDPSSVIWKTTKPPPSKRPNAVNNEDTFIFGVLNENCSIGHARGVITEEASTILQKWHWENLSSSTCPLVFFSLCDSLWEWQSKCWENVGHGFRITGCPFQIKPSKHFFSQRMENVWNSLPQRSVKMKSLNIRCGLANT